MKDLAKTKTFWGGVATIATGIGLYMAGEEVEGIQTALAGLMVIFGRHAVKKIEPPQE
jgi:hypothetical protein